MGFGLNLGIPDPRQWKKQQVSKAVIDEERVSTFEMCISRSLEFQKYLGSEFFHSIKNENCEHKKEKNLLTVVSF